jgi:hypothetical protein
MEPKPIELFVKQELERLPIGSVVKAHWPDGSQPDYLAMRGESGAASTAGAGIFGGQHWLGLASWGAELTILFANNDKES